MTRLDVPFVPGASTLARKQTSDRYQMRYNESVSIIDEPVVIVVLMSSGGLMTSAIRCSLIMRPVLDDDNVFPDESSSSSSGVCNSSSDDLGDMYMFFPLFVPAQICHRPVEHEDHEFR